MSKFGLALDNLRSVALVTAAGEVLQTSRDEHPDLFWALRGGGGNFGVATSFKYQLHPVGPTVAGGVVAHPIEHASDALKFFRDRTASLPDEHTLFAGLIHSPDGAKLAAMVTCHCGSLAAGEEAMRPLKGFGSPLLDALGPMPYCQLNAMLDDGYPKGALNHWKSSFLAQLSDGAIDIMVESFARCPDPMSKLIIEHLHGAATRVGVSDTAFPVRTSGYNFLVLGQWAEPAISDRCIAWARRTYTDMAPFFATARYVNYLDEDDVGDPVATAYGPNYRRLQQLKTKYDPNNFFHMNQNIRPSS